MRAVFTTALAVFLLVACGSPQGSTNSFVSSMESDTEKEYKFMIRQGYDQGSSKVTDEDFNEDKFMLCAKVSQGINHSVKLQDDQIMNKWRGRKSKHKCNI